MRYNLSEITELIKGRRTVYPENFTSRKVHKEQIELMLNNAIWAPNHGLTQPWRFKVLQDGALERLSDFLLNAYNEMMGEDAVAVKQDRMKNRPLQSSVCIAVCMERQETERIPEIEEVEAIACAVQNMHLTATAYGLGGFWSTPKVIYTERMNEFLGLEERQRCLGLFYVGYPQEWPKSRRKPIEYVTEWLSE